MSWFQELAGKAENILNKIDQNAATVLQSNKTDDVALPAHIVIQSATPSASSLASLTNTVIAIPPPPSKESSPKPKALSLRPSPSLSDVPKPDASSVDGSGEVNITTATSATSSSTSRRSSVSSTRPERELNTSQTSLPASRSSAAAAAVAAADGGGDLSSEVIALKIVLNEIKAERDDAKNEVRALQNDVYNLQINSNVAFLEEQCAALQKSNEELIGKNDSLELSNAKYVKSISDLESKLSKSILAEAEQRSKIEWINKEAAQAVNELQQYRSRAQTSLQLKDKLIEQLKTCTGNAQQQQPHSEPGDASIYVSSLELEHLQRDKGEWLKETKALTDQLAMLREHVANVEMSQQRKQQEFDAAEQKLNEQLHIVEQKWRDSESDGRSQARELVMVREEMARMQSEFAGKLHTKDSELLQLRNKLTSQTRIASAHSPNDFEGRVQSLTQSLVQKQTSLESVTADRNALRFQLEKIEHEYRLMMAQQRQQQQRPHTINVNDTDDAKARLPMFMQETPFDTRVSRRVKRAYSSLDAVGVHVGVFLRRYPLLRICAIFYVVLLHLWVMVVLCNAKLS